MHEAANYTYHGDAPITGLTRPELDKLQLGYMVKQEQQEEQQRQAQSSHNTTSSDYGKRKRELAQGFRE